MGENRARAARGGSICGGPVSTLERLGDEHGNDSFAAAVRSSGSSTMFPMAVSSLPRLLLARHVAGKETVLLEFGCIFLHSTKSMNSRELGIEIRFDFLPDLCIVIVTYG